MKKLMLFLFFGFSGIFACSWTIPAHGQDISLSAYDPGFCGFDLVQFKVMTKQSLLWKRQQQLEESYLQYFSTKKNQAGEKLLYTLPVVFHVIHNNGPENIPDGQVLAGLDHLNEAFANMDYYDQGTGVDTEVQFCLAKQDPDGNVTTGINHVQSPLTNMDMNTDDLAVKDLIRWDPTRYINVWVVGEICGGGLNCGVAGYAYFPASHGSAVDGIVMESSYLGSNEANSGVLVHEMGHYLGLYHTFEGGCLNDDCLANGDRVCDTPPDQSTTAVPCAGVANSCFTDTDSGFATDQFDMFINYMDYGDLSCYSAFTQGQTDRMHFFVGGVRASLLDSPACNDPCFSPITAEFAPNSDIVVNVGTTVNFVNTSAGATTYTWLIDGLSFAGTVDAAYTFNTEGSYTIELEATNADPNCLEVYSIAVVVKCPVVADFETSSNEVSPGTVVYFTNTSDNATAYEWYLDGVSQSTDQNWDFEFMNLGNYDVQLVAYNADCADTTAIDIISVTSTGLAQTGLPIWPAVDYEDGFIHTIDWRMQPVFTEMIANTGTSGGPNAVVLGGGATGAAYDGCGNLVFVAAQTGSSDPEHLFLFAPDGTELLSANTANGPGLNAVRGSQELQVVRVPGFSNEWYIIYNEWTSDNTAPANNAGYNANHFLYSRVRYEDEAILVLERDVLLTDGLGIAGTYNDGSAVSRTAFGSPDQHFLYATRRQVFSQNLSVDRFLITDTGIEWNANTGPVSANYWNLTHAGSHLELSPDEATLAVVNRNQYNNWEDLFLFDATTFTNTDVQVVSGNELVLVPDGTANDQSSVLPYAAPISTIAYDNSLPLNFLRNFDRKLARMEFSPNGRFLYITNGGYSQGSFTNLTYLAQIDLESNPLEVRLQVQNTPGGTYNPTTGVGCSIQNCLEDYRSIGAIETGYDGNIYFIKRRDPTLYVIPNPNNIMPQNLVPSDIDLSIPEEPNIQMAGVVSILPDQIDGFNYLLSQFQEVAIPISGETCTGCRDSIAVEVLLDGETVDSYTTVSCPDTLFFCADTTQLYQLWEPASGQTYDSAIVNGIVQLPNDTDYFDFSDLSGCEELCSNGLDDDNDGLIDCDDPDLADSCCCINPLVLDLGPDQQICDNGVVILNAGSGFASYSWSDNTQDSIFTGYGPGTYWVTAVDPCGQEQTDTVEVTLFPGAKLDLGPDIDLCAPDSAVSITATGFDSYQWFPDTFLDCNDCPTVNVEADSSIEYIVVANTQNGCYSADTIALRLLDSSYQVIDTAICLGATFEYEGMSIPADSTAIFQYQTFSGCDSTIVVQVTSTGASASQDTLNFSVCEGESISYNGAFIEAGESQTFTYSSSAGCDSLVVVDVAALPVYDLADTLQLCSGEEVEIFGNVINSPGTYSQTFISFDGCDSTQTYLVQYLQEIEIDAVVAPTCANEDSGAISVEVSGGLPPYTYEWAHSGETDPDLSGLPAGLYFLTVTDANNCMQMASFEIQTISQPDYAIQGQDISCFGFADGQIELSSDDPDLLYSVDGSAFSNVTVYDGFSAGLYEVVVQDAFGCLYEEQILLDEPSPLTVALPPDTTILLGESVLIPSFVGSLDSLSYSWIPAEGLDCAICPIVSASPVRTTGYTLTIVDESGCSASTDILVEISVERPLYIPNVFTPNFDGINDYFEVYTGPGVREIHFIKVFDRWGELVYQLEDVEPGQEHYGWDGTFRGERLNAGVFVFAVEVEFVDDTVELYKGSVTLLR